MEPQYFFKNEEDSQPSCAFLSSAIVKYMTALSALSYSDKDFIDIGQIYSLVFRAFDLLFHSSVQQNKNGHILINKKRYYSITDFLSGINNNINPTIKDSDLFNSEKEKHLILKCTASCEKCKECGKCLFHTQTKCDCWSHNLEKECQYCFSYDGDLNNGYHCLRCLHPVEVHSNEKISLSLNGIDPHLLNGYFSDLKRGHFQAGDTSKSIGNDFYNLLIFLKEARNEDQHGLTTSYRNLELTSEALSITIPKIIESSLYFKNIFNSIINDYDQVCSYHRTTAAAQTKCYVEHFIHKDKVTRKIDILLRRINKKHSDLPKLDFIKKDFAYASYEKKLYKAYDRYMSNMLFPGSFQTKIEQGFGLSWVPEKEFIKEIKARMSSMKLKESYDMIKVRDFSKHVGAVSLEKDYNGNILYYKPSALKIALYYKQELNQSKNND